MEGGEAVMCVCVREREREIAGMRYGNGGEACISAAIYSIRREGSVVYCSVVDVTPDCSAVDVHSYSELYTLCHLALLWPDIV